VHIFRTEYRELFQCQGASAAGIHWRERAWDGRRDCRLQTALHAKAKAEAGWNWKANLEIKAAVAA